MSPKSLDPVGYDRVENVRITPAITCGPRRARALRVPVRVPRGQETSKARDRPDRQVHGVVMPRNTHAIAFGQWPYSCVSFASCRQHCPSAVPIHRLESS